MLGSLSMTIRYAFSDAVFHTVYFVQMREVLHSLLWPNGSQEIEVQSMPNVQYGRIGEMQTFISTERTLDPICLQLSFFTT